MNMLVLPPCEQIISTCASAHVKTCEHMFEKHMCSMPVCIIGHSYLYVLRYAVGKVLKRNNVYLYTKYY